MCPDLNPAREFDDLATALKAATDRLSAADLDASERTRLTQKLLSITGSSKHDLASATRRLQGFLTELEEADRALNEPRTTRHKEHRGDGD